MSYIFVFSKILQWLTFGFSLPDHCTPYAETSVDIQQHPVVFLGDSQATVLTRKETV